MWQIDESNLDAIAIGAGILGTGGGGNPYIGQLRARQAIKEHGPVTVLSPEELPEDSSVICVGGIAVSYTHLRAHETLRYLVCRILL